MVLTAEELVGMETFQGVELIAGHTGANRPIDNVYVMEVPDIYPFIDKGGLLFTTLFPIVNDEEALRLFITRLNEKQLAGVAIKCGRYLPEVPAYMIEQANLLGFPIMILPQDANFSTLANHILTELLDKKTSLLEFREKISSQLHAFLLKGSTMEKFVDALAPLARADMLIVNANLEIEASNLKNQTIEIYPQSFSNYVTDAHDQTTKETIISVNDKSYNANLIKTETIIAGKKNFGYLIVLLDKENQVSTYLDIIIEQAIILIAYLMQTKEAIAQKERSYLDSFLRDILNERYQSQTDIIEKAKVFKWNLHFPNLLLVLQSNSMDSTKRTSIYSKVLDSEKIERIISEVFNIPTRYCKVAYYEEELITFISLAFETEINKKVLKCAERIQKSLGTWGSFSISISDPIESLADMTSGYQKTRMVHQVFKNRKEPFIEFYHQLGLYKLFHLVEDKERLTEYVMDQLGPIIDYDEKKNMHLIDTLQCFINNNGNAQRTAEELYIHYNSLRYRLNKLKALGLDLSDGVKLTEIAVACELHRYLQLN